MPFLFNKGERHPLRRPWAMGTILLIVVMVGILWLQGANSDWSPNFDAQPLPASVVGETSGPINKGAQLFYSKGCEYCHTIAGYGGKRGPDLSNIGSRLSRDDIISRILNGGVNMPPYADNMNPDDLSALVEFLKSRQ